MAIRQLFHCPNCNAALDFSDKSTAIVRCDYCHSAIIVPESLRSKVRPPSEPAPPPKKATKPVEPTLTAEEAVAKVTVLARSGQKIEAMKVYREAFPVGLKEAKEAIDQAASGLPLPIPDVRWEDQEDLPLEAAEEITHLAASGRLAEAAHLYRVTFDTSLSEAKAAVEQLVEGKSIDVARHKAREEAQATAVKLTPDGTTTPGSFNSLQVAVILFILLGIAVLMGLALIFAF